MRNPDITLEASSGDPNPETTFQTIVTQTLTLNTAVPTAPPYDHRLYHNTDPSPNPNWSINCNFLTLTLMLGRRGAVGVGLPPTSCFSLSQLKLNLISQAVSSCPTPHPHIPPPTLIAHAPTTILVASTSHPSHLC